MRLLAHLLFCTALVSCGGGGGSDNSDSNSEAPAGDMPIDENICMIVTNEIQLSNGESCTLTEAQANQYSTTAGDISCSNGLITYANSLQAQGTITFNGLTLICNT